MMTGPAAEAVLAFERPGGGSDEVGASKVAAVLHGAGVPVVVLNVCQSGAVGKDVGAAVATRLVREGCAAVVAMAYSVYAVAAAEFMAIFYERLFAGDTVTAAVTAGRRRLFEKDGRPSPKGDLPLADWLVPVHYLRRDVSFPQARTRRPKGEPSLEALLDHLRTPGAGRDGGAGSLDPAGVFVGRDDLFLQLEAAARLQKVVVLHGPGGTGKTELAKAFGRWWRDTGGVDRPEWVLWHSFEPGVASFGLDGVITETGLQIFGPDFARLDRAERSRVVEGLLTRRRLLLIWDNFETVRSMPDPAGATAPLDDAGCAMVKGFLARLVAKGKSAVVITSRTAEDWLSPLRRIEVGGLAADEAAQYAGQLLAPYPAAAPRRARRAFGELLEWLDGHPLSMRLILPRLDTAGPEALLDGLRGTTPLPGGDAGGDRATSLAASITYSFTHLTAETRRLLPAVGLFHGVADAKILALFSTDPGVPNRFAGANVQDWEQALDDAARVGLLTPLSSVMYRVHPALPAYLAARWRAEDPGGHDSVRDAATRALATSYGVLCEWLDQQIEYGDAGLAYAVIGLQRLTLGAMLGYALDHQLWEQAQLIAQPLIYYWDARGLDEEAEAWTDRVQLATENSDGSLPRLDTPAGDLWLFIAGEQGNRQHRAMRLDDAERTYRQILDMLQAQPASPQQQSDIAPSSHRLGIVAQDPGAAGGGRGLVPQVPGHQRRPREPAPHGEQLPPARHRRPGPGAAGGGRGLVPQVPGHQRGPREPAWHGGQLPRAGHGRPGPGAAGGGRGLVPRVPGHQRRPWGPAPHGGQLPPARHRRPGPGAAGGGRGLVPQVPGHLRGPWGPAPHGGQLPPARHQRQPAGAAGGGRGLVPQVPGHLRGPREPAQHGGQLPPARHRRPGPGAAGGGRGLVPQIPGHRRRPREPPRHGEQFRAAWPARRTAGTTPPGPGMDGPVRHPVPGVPPPDDRYWTGSSGAPDRPARH